MRVSTVWLTLLVVVVSLAQTPTGTIQGRFYDASGAAVPGATVTITNVKTNETRRLTTDYQGRYVQPLLWPGTYVVAGEKQGFRAVRQEDVKLDVGQNRSVDFTLELGALVQEVRVEAPPPALDLNTSSIGQVIENKRIMDLPLNARSVFALASLTPGVIPGLGATPWMGGGRNATSEVEIDGVTVIAPENNPGIAQRIYEPQVDSVEEFNVQVNSLSAEYGRFSGGVINVATKTGTNALHGTAYDFLRNSKLDANDFFANRAGREKGNFKRNQWGGTAGGPIILPGMYSGRDRSFFFFGFEATNSRSRSQTSTTVPTAQWRAGDFSDLRNAAGRPIIVYDPLTVRESGASWIRSAFPGNRIPRDRHDPVATNAMKYFPEPNVAPANIYTNLNNFFAVGTTPSDSYRIDARVDQNWSARWRMFARVSVGGNKERAVDHFRNGASPTGGGPVDGASRNVSLDHTVTLSPTLLANFRYGFGRIHSQQMPFSDGFDLVSLGFPQSYQDAAVEGRQFPRLDLSGFSSLGQIGFIRFTNAGMVHSLSGSVTKILSGHQIKIGGEYRKLLLNYAQFGFPSGGFSFGVAWTQEDILRPNALAGFSLASFLLGLPGGGQKYHENATASASSYYAGYIQDDWKVTTSLTLNLGLRYDIDLPRTERFDRLSYFGLYETSPLQGKVPAAACASCGRLMGAMHFVDRNNRRQTPSDSNNFGPRVGFSWRAAGNLVIRGGYGISYIASAIQAAGGTGHIGMEGFRSITNFLGTTDNMRTVNAYLRNPFPAGYNLPTGRALGAATNIGMSVSESLFDGYRTPYAQQWNLNLQRPLPGNMVFEIGYLGNRGIALVDGDGGQAYNQLPASFMALGADLIRTVPNPFYGLITNPTSTLNRETVQYGQTLRPYPHYGNVSSLRKPIGNSIYHAMTFRADKRFSRGLGLLLSYTAGKLIDDCSSAVLNLGPVAGTRLDAYNRRLERAVSSMDVAQRMVISYIYELPVGKGRRFLAAAPRGINLLISGWQINGITTFQSGTPLIIGASQNNTGIFTLSQRPNNNGQSAKLTGGTTDQRLARWFDTSVFSQPPTYTFGTTGRTLPDARLPGRNSTDLSVFKNTYLRPDRRLNLQYRLEMFSAFNTPQFNGPGTTVDTPAFGVISGGGGARQIQMALKLIW